MLASGVLTLTLLAWGNTALAAADGMYGMYGYGSDSLMMPEACPCPGTEGLYNFGGLNLPNTLLQELLPLPETALPPPIDPAVGYVVQELAPDVYVLNGGRYITLFAVTNDGVVLFDAPPANAAFVAPAVANVTDQPVSHIVYTHTHTDHIGAAADIIEQAGGTVEVVSSMFIAELLAERGDPRKPVPTSTFEGDTATMDIGGLTIEFEVVYDVHDEQDIIVYLPASKVLQVVDIVYPGWLPFRGLGVTPNAANYLAVHDTLLAHDFDTFVGSHLTRVGTRQDVELNKELVEDIKAGAAAGLTAVSTEDILAAVGAGASNPWAFTYYQAYLQVEVCYQQVLEKWGGRLGGVDVYGRSACLVWRDYLNLDAAPEM